MDPEDQDDKDYTYEEYDAEVSQEEQPPEFYQEQEFENALSLAESPEIIKGKVRQLEEYEF